MILPPVGFSLIVTNVSDTQFLGLAGTGYDTAIAVWNDEWMATLILVFFATLILAIYLQSKISTVPEFLEKRYDSSAGQAGTLRARGAVCDEQVLDKQRCGAARSGDRVRGLRDR